MRKLATFAVCLLTYIGFGLYTSQFDFLILPDELHPENPLGYHDYRGATHVHTTLSSGSGTPEEIILEGNLASQDFLFFTDLNQFKGSSETLGYSDNVLALRGGEYGYLDSHLLFYDLVKHRSLQTLGQIQVLFADLLSQKNKDSDEGLLVLAHPFKHGFSWSGPYPVGLDGIELINLKEVWEKAWQNNKGSFLWSALIYPFNPRYALLRLYQDPEAELQLLDTLQRSRPTVALAGADATAKPIRLGSWSWHFPTYRNSFEFVANHLLLPSELTGISKSDGLKVFAALKTGQFYLSLDLLGDPKGFVAEMRDSKTKYPMGSTLKAHNDLKLYVRLPRRPRVPYEIVVFKDGNNYMSSDSLETSLTIHSPGVYRVTVRVAPTLPVPDGKRWFTWIYTNSFYVR